MCCVELLVVCVRRDCNGVGGTRGALSCILFFFESGLVLVWFFGEALRLDDRSKGMIIKLLQRSLKAFGLAVQIANPGLVQIVYCHDVRITQVLGIFFLFNLENNSLNTIIGESMRRKNVLNLYQNCFNKTVSLQISI